MGRECHNLAHITWVETADIVETEVINLGETFLMKRHRQSTFFFFNSVFKMSNVLQYHSERTYI